LKARTGDRNDARQEGAETNFLYEICLTPDGRHVLSPSGKIEGGAGFGQ
jgi:hypothetical protein